MKNFFALLTKEKGKAATNEWENDDPDILRALYSVYKKIRTILLLYITVNWFKQRYISSFKSYKYFEQVHKLSIKTMVLTSKDAMYMRTIPLTLIWVGFLRVRFEVGGEGDKTCDNCVRFFSSVFNFCKIKGCY